MKKTVAALVLLFYFSSVSLSSAVVPINTVGDLLQIWDTAAVSTAATDVAAGIAVARWVNPAVTIGLGAVMVALALHDVGNNRNANMIMQIPAYTGVTGFAVPLTEGYGQCPNTDAWQDACWNSSGYCLNPSQGNSCSQTLCSSLHPGSTYIGCDVVSPTLETVTCCKNLSGGLPYGTSTEPQAVLDAVGNLTTGLDNQTRALADVTGALNTLTSKYGTLSAATAALPDAVAKLQTAIDRLTNGVQIKEGTDYPSQPKTTTTPNPDGTSTVTNTTITSSSVQTDINGNPQTVTQTQEIAPPFPSAPTYDTSMDTPAKKSWPSLITSFMSSNPIVSAINGSHMELSGAQCSFTVGSAFGKPLSMNWCWMTSYLDSFGTLALTFASLTAVWIIFRRD